MNVRLHFVQGNVVLTEAISAFRLISLYYLYARKASVQRNTQLIIFHFYDDYECNFNIHNYIANLKHLRTLKQAQKSFHLLIITHI